MKIIESYFNHLAGDPERIDRLFFWVLCTVLYWAYRWKFRERMMRGLEGGNQFFEGYEQVIDLFLWMTPPIMYYASFITDVPLYVWCTIWGGLGFALFGRSILDYGLAFLGKEPVNRVTVSETVKEEIRVEKTTS